LRIVFVSLVLLMAGWIVCALPVSSLQAAESTTGIAAVVGEDAISTSELQDRLRLLLVSSGTRPTPEAMRQVAPQALGTLIDERIQMQEAEKLGLEVSPQEIRERFEQIAKMNNIPPEKFEEMITSSGVNMQTMRNQIRAQVAWTKVVQSKLRPQIRITDNDIENQIERFKRSIGKDEYLVAEIFLPVDEDQTQSEVKELADSLIGKMKEGARFSQIAVQFSRAPGANQGGDMGWIQEGQLAEELDEAIQSTEPGQITKPILMNDGYHIMFVRDKRAITEETIPSEEQIRQTLGTKRLERVQRRYLMDLKAATFIDVRV